MLPTSKAHWWDAHQACLAALSFVEGVDVLSRRLARERINSTDASGR